MNITNETAQLVSDLENIIGRKCYNSSSYNGYTGEYGAHFRYPVKYPNIMGTFSKTRGSKEDLKLSKVSQMRYCFGANELFIGEGIIDLLNELEQRFGISFEKLLDEENEQCPEISLFQL